jgi:hypothetical protein
MYLNTKNITKIITDEIKLLIILLVSIGYVEIIPVINIIINLKIFELSNKLFNHLGTGCKVYPKSIPVSRVDSNLKKSFIIYIYKKKI